jgi:four helix bundle protein
MAKFFFEMDMTFRRLTGLMGSTNPKPQNMKSYDVNRFNQDMRSRTRKFAVNTYGILTRIRLNELSRVPVKQLVRCATSVAANYSSATRGWSEAEFYSKICIVTEECDECLFWIDFLADVKILSISELSVIKNETEELLRIFASIKKKLKSKRQ